MFSTATLPQNGGLTGNPPTVTYTPNAGFDGVDSFTFTVNDGTDNSAPATVSITVQDNVAPTADNDTAVTLFETAVIINVLDGDSDGGDGDGLTITGVTQPANGSIAISNNLVVYTPNAGFSGEDIFMYTVSDGIDTATATVSITVQDNIAPTADNDTAVTLFETAVTINVLNGDSDGGDGDALTITEVTQPANGSTAISNNMVVYTPNAGFAGDDSFMYTVFDGVDTATATVTVTIVPGSPNPPVAVDDVADPATGIPQVISVLANDSDADGDSLTVDPDSVTPPANGRVEISNDGQTVTYTSNAEFLGPDEFMYTVVDGTGNTATATVLIIVQPATSDRGANTPDPMIEVMIDAVTGATEVIQVSVTASALEDVNVTTIMVDVGEITGGDPSLDEMIAINIVNDANGNSVADVGEEVLASDTLNNVDANNMLSLDLTLAVTAGTTVNLLVTVESTPITTAALVPPQLRIPASRLGWLALLPAVVGLMVFRRLRRRFPRLSMALAMVFMACSLFLTSCDGGGGDGGDSGENSVTFTPAIPANGIAGAGATTGGAFATPAGAITGPTVTVTL